MKNKLVQYSFIAVIVILVSIIALFSLSRSNINISDTAETVGYELNSSEEKYIEENDEICVYVDEQLRYLMGNGYDGFLMDVMDDVFRDIDIGITFTDDEETADCSLMIVTDEVRSDDDKSYTSPLFKQDGVLFVRSDSEDITEMSGVVMDDRMSSRKLSRVKYDGNSLSFETASSAEEALEKARNDGLSFILGDRSAVLEALGADKDYISTGESLYSLNVCLITDSSSEALHGILNKCVHNADMYAVTYKASQKWFDGNGPLYEEGAYGDSYILILVIFTAILLVFFIYYNTNKNLYDELNDRIEKLAESRKELKATFEGVGYYLAEMDLEGVITDINRAFYDFVRSDTINRRIWDVLDLDDENREKLRKMVMGAGADEGVGSTEIVLKKQIIKVDVFPIENARGIMEKLLFMATDVTGERMAERQMIQDNKMIAVGQLAAGVAHEIRNPLGIIRNYCYVLKNMKGEDVREKAIDRIEKAVDTSGKIIDSLLDFSRASGNEETLVDIEKHVKELLRLNKNIFKKKSIHTDVICPERVETYIIVESLNMILLNLISNATDAMYDHGNLTIKVVKYKDTFEISVRDTGTGMDEAILQEIFNPFFTTKGSTKGNGLGLYIVHNETGKLNGKIEVESEVGAGSEFRLTLPLRID